MHNPEVSVSKPLGKGIPTVTGSLVRSMPAVSSMIMGTCKLIADGKFRWFLSWVFVQALLKLFLRQKSNLNITILRQVDHKNSTLIQILWILIPPVKIHSEIPRKVF